MTRAPSSARTVQWAPPCVLRLEERLGWGHPAEGCGVPGPRCRGLCREHAQQAGPCRAPARGVAAVPVLGAGVAGGPGSAGPEEGCPLRSEAAAGLPICVGRGQSLPMSGPGRLPSLPAARAARGGRDELELIRPSLYRNVARQLNVSPHSETAVTSAFLAVAAQIFSAGGSLMVGAEQGLTRGTPSVWPVQQERGMDRRHVGQSGVPVLGGRGAGRRLCAAGPARRGARSRRLPRGVRAQDAGELAAEAWRMDRHPHVRGQHRPRLPRPLAGGRARQRWPLPEGGGLHAAARAMSRARADATAAPAPDACGRPPRLLPTELLRRPRPSARASAGPGAHGGFSPAPAAPEPGTSAAPPRPTREEAADTEAGLPSVQGDCVKASIPKVTWGWRGWRGHGGFDPTEWKLCAVA
ncbi:bcl-2-related ovarian killer protein isoform X2 [Pteropus medius]|uniref:bcl-2-related ovarian killer protein isoform X2 n=2 Tax=Pteropus vampyrus TaxID=132908 RepID=UPI00196A72C6|nr:bcl-2-related ovarian killer protein isoform X2 [Pteropus giganteus]